MVRLTNITLTNDRKKETTAGEVLKFMGIIVLMTQYEFGERVELWSQKFHQSTNSLQPLDELECREIVLMICGRICDGVNSQWTDPMG
jgi:hypothetical protein